MRKTRSEKKKHGEQFPEGTCLQTVPDFFSWLKYNYSPPEKYQGCEYFGRMVYHSAPSCSSPVLGLLWRCFVGWWSWGSCRRQKHWKTGTPPRGEHTFILNCWSLWLGPAITRWWVNVHFFVKDMSLVWGRLFPLKYVSQSVTDEEWTVTGQMVEPMAKQLWTPGRGIQFPQKQEPQL